jgi:GAF domain-containing protein
LVIDTILILVMVSLFVPLRSSVQKVIDKVFYGGWYDYRLGINQITQGLELATSLEMLATSVSQRLLDTLRLEETCVFLRDAQGDFSVIQAAFPPGLSHPPSSSYPILPRSSLTYLLKLGVVERKSLLDSLAEVAVSPEELQLLQSEQIHLWVPVIGRGQILGLLALGPKVGGDVFSSDDMDILRVVAREIGPIIENLHLVSYLRNHAADLEQRVHERTVELFDAKERVEAILASVGEGVVVTDLDGNNSVNTAFEKSIRLYWSEVAGRYLTNDFQ